MPIGSIEDYCTGLSCLQEQPAEAFLGVPARLCGLSRCPLPSALHSHARKRPGRVARQPSRRPQAIGGSPSRGLDRRGTGEGGAERRGVSPFTPSIWWRDRRQRASKLHPPPPSLHHFCATLPSEAQVDPPRARSKNWPAPRQPGAGSARHLGDRSPLVLPHPLKTTHTRSRSRLH